MKKLVVFLVILSLLLTVDGSAQRRHTVMFYNVENLFDTIDDPSISDEEFTVTGANKWTGDKYANKLINLASVFKGVAGISGGFPDIIGLAEIENRVVLDDLVAAKGMRRAGYKIVHYDSPDPRGIDVALLYRPGRFSYEGSSVIKTVVPSMPDFRTRDILMVWGRIDRELFYFFVCHWPSRRGGHESSFLRIAAADCVRGAVDSVMLLRPESKVVVMGDMNDDPTDESLYTVLGAKGGDINNLAIGDFFNPFHAMFGNGHGTLAYRDKWNLFDNIVVSKNLIGRKKLRLIEGNTPTFYGNIFNPEFMREQSGRFKGYPFRSYAGTNFLGGYSDHFPVFIYISR